MYQQKSSSSPLMKKKTTSILPFILFLASLLLVTNTVVSSSSSPEQRQHLSTVKKNPFTTVRSIQAVDKCSTFVTKPNDACDTTQNNLCIPGYQCLNNQCTMVTFKVRSQCKSSSECQTVLTSNPSTYCFEGYCHYLQRYEGDFCVDHTQCRSANCVKNKCVAVAVGEVCVATAGTAQFCTKNSVCLLDTAQNKRLCTELNSLDEACLVPGDTTTISGKDCRTPYLCNKAINKCVSPVTKLGAPCDPNIVGHCTPTKSRYCKRVQQGGTDYVCAQYRELGEKCDLVNDVKCEVGLQCPIEQPQICQRPYKTCTKDGDCTGGEKCYCSGKRDKDGNLVEGYCGLWNQRNCQREFTLFDACLKMNCNPYVAPDDATFVMADEGSCVRTKCDLTMRKYYDCVKSDLARRKISLPTIQGYNGASRPGKSVQLVLTVVFTVVFALLACL